METREAVDIEKQGPCLEKKLSALFDISSAVSHTRNLEEFYGIVHNTLSGIFGTHHFYIALHDPVRDTVTFPYYTGEKEEKRRGSHFKDILSVCKEVIASGRPMICSGKNMPSLARQRGQKIGAGLSMIWAGAPLVIRGRPAGVMAVRNECHSTDLNLLEAVSLHVALAIERNDAETRIRDQRNVLGKISDSSPVGMALIENRVFKWVNREMVRMFGYGSEEAFRNRNVKMVYGTAEDYEFAGRSIFQECASQGKMDYEMDLVKQDGSRFPVHVRLNSTDRENPMDRTIVSFTDISRRRVAEKESFERERLQGVLEMAGAVCHEINQPLQAIIGYSELLLLDNESGAAVANLDSIKSQVGRLGKITSTLANITRYKTVDYPGNTRIVDIWGAGPPKMK